MLTVIQPKELAPSSDLTELLNTWQEALNLRVAAGELAENTVTSYRRGADKFLDWCAANGIDNLTPDTFRSWKSDLLDKNYRPATVNTWLSGVKALFSWAVEYQRLPYNPTENVKSATRKGKSKKHVRESLTDDEVRRVLALPDPTTDAGARDLAILSIMAHTAVRQVEIHRADLADLRTEKGKIILDVTGKGHAEADEFVVLANPKAEEALHAWLSVRGNKPGALFTSLSDRSHGERLSLRALRGIVKSYFKLAGVVGNKTTHSLRHTAITKAILKGAPPQKAQSMARHKSLDTTMIYYHEVDRLENPAEAFIDYEK